MSYIPYGAQSISEADITAVVEVLRSPFLTQGPVVGVFERHIAEYCGVPHAVAVNSATSALHIACMALGLGPGDRLWTSPITFAATANAARFCGADVDFVDIDPATGNLSVAALSEKLASTPKAELPKVVVPVHLGGQSCQLREIAALARQYGFKVLEDASHAIGGRYEGQPVGDCRYSDICVFSFHPVKIITTGEGGLATTKDEALAEKMRLHASHGINKDPAKMLRESDGPWYMEQVCLGYNYRMTEMQAALGVSQVGRLDEFVRVRNEIATRYNEALKKLPVDPLVVLPESHSAYHLYVVRLRAGESKKSHRDVFTGMREDGIGVSLNYIPVYRHPYYRELGFAENYLPEAEAYYGSAICLPLHVGLTPAQFDRVVTSLGRHTT